MILDFYFLNQLQTSTCHELLLVYLSGGGVDHLPTDQVGLVPHQQPGDTFTGVTVDLIQPQFHVVEGLLRKKERR